MPDAASAFAFLRQRFGKLKGDILLCALPEPRDAPRAGRAREYRLKRPVDPELVASIVERETRPNRGLFFCVGTLKPDAVKTAAGAWRAKSNILMLPGVHADIDFKHLHLPAGIANPTAEVTRLIGKSPWAPRPVALSGGGMHGYWMTPEPLETQDLDQAEAVMRALARHFGGDPAVAEVARLMRLPGSINWKYGEPRPVVISQSGIATIDIWDEEIGAGKPVIDRQLVELPSRASIAGNVSNAYEAYAAQHQAPIDIEQRLAGMTWHGTGESGVHQTQLQVTASMLAAGIPRDEVIREVLDATLKKPFAQGWNAQAEQRVIAAMVDSFIAKMEIEQPIRVNGVETIRESHETIPAQLPKLPFINTNLWEDAPVPPREWSVEERIPVKQPTLLTGEGGGGKSLIELMLSTAHVLGRDWLGVPVAQGPAIYLSAEDDEQELHRRLDDINNYYGARHADSIKGGLHLLSYADAEDGCLLATAFRDGRIRETMLFKQLLEAAHDIKPIHIGIDTLADVFGGNEIDRSQVRQFIGLLRRLAIAAEGSLVLVAHPSLTGIATGTGLSGSTHWHNGVRARMYFRVPKSNEGEDDNNKLLNGPRELAFMKNNYGPVADSIILRYQNGVYIPQTTSSFQRLAREQQADEQFIAMLRRLTEQGRTVSPKSRAPNYAPTAFANQPNSNFVSKEFAAAMERLLERRAIHIVTVGQPAHERQRLVEGPPRGEV